MHNLLSYVLQLYLFISGCIVNTDDKAFQRSVDLNYIRTLRWRDTKIMIFMTLAGSYTFLAIGICADGVSVCS